MKKIVLLTVILFQFGCTSIEIKSNLQKDADLISNLKFRIEEVKAEGAELGGIYNYNETYSSVNLQNIAQKEYPSLFSRDKGSFPIQLNISVSSKHNFNFASFLVYLCSLGILPVWSDGYTDYDVYVRLKNKNSNETYEIGNTNYKTEYSQLLTVFSPLGLMNGSGEDKYNEVHLTFSTYRGVPAQNFYAEQLIHSVNSILLKNETLIEENIKAIKSSKSNVPK